MLHSVCGSTSWLHFAARRVPVGALFTLLVGLFIHGSAPAIAQEFDEMGGDDVLIATGDSFLPSPSMDIAENGDIYAAVATIAVGSARPEILIYRSQDGGDSWPLWGRINVLVGAAPLALDSPVLHIGEGTQSRIYVAYRFRGAADTRYSIRVGWCPLNAATGSFTTRTVFSDAGVDFQSPSIHSDEMSNADYKLYVAAMGSGPDGGDIWFSRSADFGSTWATAYKIFWLTAGGNLFYPEIRYGRNGVIHCVCYYDPTGTPGTDMAVAYTRAVNYAAGFSDWQPWQYLTSPYDGTDEFHISIAASHATNKVVLGYSVRSGGVILFGRYRWSDDSGATWPSTNANSTMDNQLPHLLANDARNRIHSWGNISGSDNFGVNDFANGGTTWSPNLSHMDRAYTGVPHTSPGGQYFDINAARDNRPGFVWMVHNPAGTDSLFFDAAWRADPGYPNLTPGFPVEVDPLTACEAPPAICELDGADRQSEIVFGTADGNIHAYNHDGTPVPGWPVDIGIFDLDATIAVGNITGTIDNEVVAANMSGEIFVFTGNGTPVSRWPVDTGTGLPAFVAIGAISTSERQVVVTSGSKVFLFNGDGTRDSNFPVILTDETRGAPAIGDVNGDGFREIVVAREHSLSVISHNGTVQFTRNIPGRNLQTTPALGDLDLDGDLEIAVTTGEGDLYVLRNDGTDFPGWPWHHPAGLALTSPVLANIRPLMQPEVIVGVADAVQPEIHAFTWQGAELTGYPRPQSTGSWEYPSPIADVLDEAGSDVVRAGQDSTGYAWNELGADLPGWPRDLGYRCIVSPASGDIDGDNKVEVVMVTAWPTMLVVIDVGADVYRSTSNPWSWWTMYGYNPLRQSCLFCDTDAVSGVPDQIPAVQARLAPPRPNPSFAPVRLQFEIELPGAVRLDVFDVTGRLVRRLVKAELPAGQHEVVWDGRSDSGVPAAAGSYFLRLTVNDGSGSPIPGRKMVLLK